MPKSPSNRSLLVEDLRTLVILYRRKPSTLLVDLENFLDSKGIGVGQHRREIEKVKTQKDRDLLKELFEERPDFPGWDAL